VIQDLDRYKSEVKGEISDWLMNLKDDNINDWLIVIVVNDESKVKTKILRTSVYDKVKSDFCGKNSDRFDYSIVLLYEIKYYFVIIQSCIKQSYCWKM